MLAPVPPRANYHRGVISEAMANMLAHRDLALRDQPSRLHIFDHSLEFVNSRRGAGFSPVAQKAIRYGIPQRLNPQLAAVLTNPAYGLKLPVRGLPQLLREVRPEPREQLVRQTPPRTRKAHPEARAR